MLRALVTVSLLVVPAVAAAQGTGTLSGCTVARNDIPARREAVNDPKRPGAEHWTLAGNVRIDCGKLSLWADAIDWFTDEDVFHLRGHVLLDEPRLHILADHADLNKVTKLGTFYAVSGTAQTSEKKTTKDMFGGVEPDVMFTAASLERTGENTFRIRSAYVTSCVQATPRWSLSGTSGTFVKDRRVTLWNAVLRVKNVPVFYVPFIYYPVNREARSTGFLMPSFGSSSVTGFQLSNAFFWAIDRSRDLTLYDDYMKKAGNGVGAEYRFVTSPVSNGSLRVYTLGSRANSTLGTNTPRSYTVDGQLSQGLAHGFHLTAQSHYFTSVTTTQLFQQNALDTSTDRSLSAALTGGRGRYRFSSSVTLNDVYSSQTAAQRRGYAPRLSLTMGEAPLGKSRLYFGVTGETAYLVSQDDITQPSTNHSLWRFDAMPTLRWPMSTLPFLQATTSASWRVTEWLESRDPVTLVQRQTPLFRELFSIQTRVVGPTVERVWQPATSGYADRVKHVIEPSVSIQWNSPFDRLSQVVQTDGTDSIVGGTTTITYGLSNRLLIRPRARKGGTPGNVRTILSVDVTQSHYTNALAAAADSQYLPCATGAFSAIQVAVSAQPAQRLTGQFHTDINPEFHTPCTLGANGGVNFKPLQITVGWTKRQYIPGLINFNDPTLADHFVNGTITFKQADGRLGGAYSINYDVHHDTVIQQRLVMFYNSQCCGLSVDYQTRSLPDLLAGLRSNHQIGISFTLAGLGSFSNPLGSFAK